MDCDKFNVLVLGSERETIDNIYHVLGGEIGCLSVHLGTYIYDIHAVLLVHHDPTNKANMWRLRIMQAIFQRVYIHTLPDVYNDENTIIIYKPHDGFLLPFTSFDFNLQPDPVLCSYINKIKQGFNIPENHIGTDIVFIKRTSSRVLYDMLTKRLLDEVLVELVPGIKICVIEEMTADEQAEAFSNAKVLIGVHGAALTNLIFLPSNGLLMEINFRRQWTCTPLCEDHAHGRIPAGMLCQDFLPYFHKADYFCLSQLLGKNYIELGMDDLDGIIDESRNPIQRKSCFINVNEIVSRLRGRVYE